MKGKDTIPLWEWEILWRAKWWYWRLSPYAFSANKKDQIVDIGADVVSIVGSEVDDLVGVGVRLEARVWRVKEGVDCREQPNPFNELWRSRGCAQGELGLEEMEVNKLRERESWRDFVPPPPTPSGKPVENGKKKKKRFSVDQHFLVASNTRKCGNHFSEDILG